MPGPGIEIASLPELGPGGSWSAQGRTCLGWAAVFSSRYLHERLPCRATTGLLML